MAARKAVDQELTRERILDAARELFVTHGYRNVSMRQIGRELGYSHGSIYYHFENKAELFYALVREGFRLLDSAFRHVMEQELAAEEKLAAIMLGLIEFGLTHQSHYEIMFLIKDEEVKGYLQQEPYLSYEKFAGALHELSGRRANVAQIWSVFLALHGFISHYCKTGITFAEAKPAAVAHVQFLLKVLN
ncbi:TetR/AcrR family transcriptional regulator [Aneurinibacillus sp. BA2021]|nr:TetR/AcrR family transcriptional regulator [Aneurinibacillus sp. BA2021]